MQYVKTYLKPEMFVFDIMCDMVFVDAGILMCFLILFVLRHFQLTTKVH